MRLDSANRSFATLALSSLLLVVYVFCCAAGCVLIPLIASRVSHHGIGGLTDGSHNLLAAVLFVVLASAGAVLGGRSLWRQVTASRVLALRAGSLALALPGRAGEGGRRGGACWACGAGGLPGVVFVCLWCVDTTGGGESGVAGGCICG